MAYKQSPGRMNMPKTGAGIPSALTMPDPDPKDPKRKYGDIKKSSSKDESGRTTVTVTQPFSAPSGNKTNKSYKQFAAEGGDVDAAKKFNTGKSGSRTTSYSYGGNKGAGIKPVSKSTPKPKIDSSKKPTLKKVTKKELITSSKIRKYDAFDEAHNSTAEQRKKSHNPQKKKKNIFKVKSNLRKRVSRGGSFKPGCLTD